MAYFTVLIVCLIIIAVIMVYFPTVIIREMTKVLKVLQQIETNTRKP
jgi:hypothetical protein